MEIHYLVETSACWLIFKKYLYVKFTNTNSAQIQISDNIFQIKIIIGSSDGGKLVQEAAAVNTVVNYCKIDPSVSGNFLLKIILEKIKRYSNFTFKCPLQKGFYHLKNYPVSDQNFPKFLVQYKSYVGFVNITGKISKLKQLIWLGGFKAVSQFD